MLIFFTSLSRLPPPFVLLFSPPGSVPPLTFIARGRGCFLVTAGMHHGGVKHAPQTETAPLIVFIYCRNRRG